MSTKESTPKPTASGSSRRNYAFKGTDGSPLMRKDIQFDLLQAIFSDQNAVFTDPFTTNEVRDQKYTFRDLYISALVHSPRSSKAVRDKISESALFGTEFAMLSLLANVGRISTTMAFFPETRTTLRSYHPIPALSNSDGNLQDAPRIKNTLKACVIPDVEAKGAPTTPSDILLQGHGGRIPTTTITNLIFVLTVHSGAVGRTHFEDDCGIEFTELFSSIPVPSAERARVFLWLCYYYLEAPGSPNPFADNTNIANNESDATRAPSMRLRTAEEMAALPPENVDPPEEIERAQKLAEQRRNFISKERANAIAREEGIQSEKSAETTPGPTGTGPTPVAPINAPVNKSSRGKKNHGTLILEPPAPRGRHARSKEALRANQMESSHSTNVGDPYPYPQHLTAPVQSGSASMAGKSKTGRRRGKHNQNQQYEMVYSPPSPERTMFEQAWHVINRTDALINSDDELGDEHVRLDCIRRLETLNRIRGKPPTPENGQNEHQPSVMEVDANW